MLLSSIQTERIAGGLCAVGSANLALYLFGFVFVDPSMSFSLLLLVICNLN